MENISRRNNPLSRRETAYYRRRQQNRVFSQLTKCCAEQAELGRITRMEMSEKLSKDPAQITRWLSAPSNLTLDTISDILRTMDAEMDHFIVRFVDRAQPNYAHPLVTQSLAPPEVQELAKTEDVSKKTVLPQEAVVFKNSTTSSIHAIVPSIATATITAVAS